MTEKVQNNLKCNETADSKTTGDLENVFNIVELFC